MEVVLLKEVKRLGTEGAIVTVKPGFARNYLIPNGVAVPATAQQLKALDQAKQHRNQKVAREKDHVEQLKRRIEGRSLTLCLKLGEGGKPFGAITVNDIVEGLAKEQIKIDRHAIKLDEPIKALGFYETAVRLHPEVTATLKLVVSKA